MEATGRNRRLRRLWGSVSGRTVLMPIDQPVTMGPITGLDAIDTQLTRLLAGAPNAIIGHRGVLRRVPAEAARATSVIMHLSAGTALSGRGHVKKLTGDVAEAVQLGADAVSVQVTFGVPEETDMLHDLAQVAAGCARWGMPLLAMVYVAGVDPAHAPEKIAHGARAVAELGSDIVKAPYTGCADSFATVVAGCFAPVVMAGGEPSDSWEDVLLDVKDALSAGAAGVCIGRKVQQHRAPDEALADLHALVHATNFG
ncbi:class I fructose-bisphosphate aldolase [Micromonospora sp. NPDC049282]|uniref:class I fructose-bisphosphate aldolase n=1 Tax=Micromonospora sp. NPDC049282 TaxID=3364269 RepID=UPI0037142A1E